MKNIQLLLLLLLCTISYGQKQDVSYSISPSPFNEDDSITITFDGASIDEATWGVNNNALYLWSWSYDTNLANQQDCPTNGSWTDSNEANRLSYNASADEYNITFTPTTFYNRTGIGQIGFLIKAKDGSGDKQSNDYLESVGTFLVTLSAPTNNTTILNSGDNLNISATNTGGNADYVLKANGNIINSQNTIASYTFNDANITENKNYSLEVTFSGETKIITFSVIIDPGALTGFMPENYEDGITYDESDPSKATLVLYAPYKDFVYVAGSFNNWQPDSNYAMKRDPSRNGKFWITLTGLTSKQIETYQYWAVDKTPLANSPTLVKTADPYSTLVLSPFDDPYIPSESYPILPAYPVGQEREVSVLQTGQSDFNWQVTNFTKPKKEDLVIYEVLVRDFDADRNFQDIIDRIDYFKNLNINAIELMPVMEFEGNESWGYNTSFHMALDKFYGTQDKFKELIDICHQNGIAVILDLAINHAFGRNPMVRLWMNDADNDGWGEPSSENPYFNQTPKHTYNVGSDFNHSNGFTNYYTKRVVKHWIEEFHIDGIRWDLTKGFTQNCENNEGCTNDYNADRVAILKDYADYSWSLDPDHYVIFEHLGTDWDANSDGKSSRDEETEWANYRIDEGKGIMLWGKMTDPYNELTMGYSSDISEMGHNSRGYSSPRLVGYAESHDEERLMYKNLLYGNSNADYDITNLETALSRMSALGAVSLTIPGPKMIWHFGDLGMENSIFTCNSGSVNTPEDATPGDCKLDTKPQPQWTNNWLSVSQRNQIYNDWSRINNLKINEPVFEGNYTISSNNLTPRISIYTGNENTSGTTLKNVIIVANFDIVTQSINPNFPYSGDWYDLLDNSVINAATTSIQLKPGEFKIYGNQMSTLSVSENENRQHILLYPNPANNTFKVNQAIEKVDIFDMTGKLVKQFDGDYEKGTTFNISDLSKNIYLVKISDGFGQSNIFKLVKL
ncbi:alpha-amylase family glycosyl hydrolase [Aestuariibaculum sediminum]|uniref:T9SS type A sorting domain-containing protein n=1 Tax=Aestuariibaculum sediminum TaxID=2770637 RepID=A0A8J6U8L2_9FLAO|nr:alpha-amylase family glycosyl hydrolase [Aestuariibaculum sediminum]MBD0833415.1 T9SS type A sorting domain-containing protein [Aestuariibaculum sediminum]